VIIYNICGYRRPGIFSSLPDSTLVSGYLHTCTISNFLRNLERLIARRGQSSRHFAEKTRFETPSLGITNFGAGSAGWCHPALRHTVLTSHLNQDFWFPEMKAQRPFESTLKNDIRIAQRILISLYLCYLGFSICPPCHQSAACHSRIDFSVTAALIPYTLSKNPVLLVPTSTSRFIRERKYIRHGR